MNFQFNSNYWSIYSFLILFILINIFKKINNILIKLKNFSSVYVLNLHWVRTAAIAEHCCSGSHFFLTHIEDFIIIVYVFVLCSTSVCDYRQKIVNRSESKWKKSEKMKESDVPAIEHEATMSPTKAEFANFAKFVKRLEDASKSYALVCT